MIHSYPAACRWNRQVLVILIICSIMLSVNASYASSNSTHFAQNQQAVEQYGLSQCQKPGFRCVTVKSGQTWGDRFPNKIEREIVMRLNRTNVALKYRHWLLIPKNLSRVNYMDLAPFPKHIMPSGRKLLLVDLPQFAFAAYNADGNLVFWGPATGGKAWCKDLGRSCQSVAGKFEIYRVQGENCQSKKYPLQTEGGAPMPWCMHYFRGFAIHGSTLAGFQHRSRGCVRIFKADAKWLNQHFVKKGTEVIIRR